MGEKDQLEAVEGEDLEIEQSAGTSESATEENEGSSEQQEQSTESEDGKKVTLPPHVQEAVNKAIGRQHRLAQEQREEADRLRQELETLRGKQPQVQRPVIPPVPDPLDDDFDQQMQERDEAIKRQMQFDSEQQQRQWQEQQKATSEQQEQQQAFVAKAVSYKQRADKLHIEPQALQMAGQIVSAYGLPDVLADHILSHEQGPLITQHLASNLNDLEKLGAMDPVSAGIYLATSVVPRLPTVKTKTGAPPPPETVEGQPAPPTRRGPPGCKFY